MGGRALGAVRCSDDHTGMSADRATFDRAWSAFAEGRLADLARELHPDVEWHSAPLATVFRGAEQLPRWSEAVARTWKSLTVVLEEVDDSVEGVVASSSNLNLCRRPSASIRGRRLGFPGAGRGSLLFKYPPLRRSRLPRGRCPLP